MSDSFNLPLLRIWCHRRQAWLSFCTRNHDRYFVNPSGYFVELPDGRLAPITARVAFPLVNCYPSVMVRDLEVQAGFGSASYFVFAPVQPESYGKPEAIRLSQLRLELEQILPVTRRLSPPERYLAIRLVESGLLDENMLEELIVVPHSGKTLGQEILSRGLLRWELILAACLDMSSSAQLDSEVLEQGAAVRQWELAGEILIAMGKISRANMELALQIKREGQRTIGEILAAIGACSPEQIQQSLTMQTAVRQARAVEGGKLGELLVHQGLLAQRDLQAVLKLQQAAGQPLYKILLSTNLIKAGDLEEYKKQNIWHALNDEIDDGNFGNWLLQQGRVNNEQLQYVYSLQSNSRSSLGDMLVAMGICTAQDVGQSLQIQEKARQAVADVDKLGDILLANGSVEAKQLERALVIQGNGTKSVDEILLSNTACSMDALELAVELQRRWHRLMANQDDRLGEVLAKRGFLSQEALQQAVAAQQQTGNPMGQVLVEHEFVTPEEIIATLLMRDYKRQCELHQFIKRNFIQVRPAGDTMNESAEQFTASWF